MELVYLWVEDYKNIHHQGFNFSTKFECIFNYQYDNVDGLERLKENFVLEIKPKEHIENFFGENINVTAIVGENGSGKSRLLELLSQFRFQKLARSKKFIFLVYFYQNEFFVLLNTKADYNHFNIFKHENITNKTQYKVATSHTYNDLFWLSFFSNSSTEIDYVQNVEHYDSFYNGCSSKMLLEDKFAYLLNLKSDFFKLLNKDFIFNTMHLELNLKNINFNIYNEDTKEKTRKLQFFFVNNIDTSSLTSGEEKNDPSKEVYVYNFLAFFFLNIYIDLIDDFSNELNEKFRIEFLDGFIVEIQPYLDKKKNGDSSIPYNILILSLLVKQFKQLKEFISVVFKDQQGQLDHFKGKTKEIDNIDEYNGIANYIFDYFELDKTLNILVSKSEKIQEYSLKEYHDLFNKNSFFTYLHDYGILRINFFDSNSKITFLDLSTGEQQLITFFVYFSYTLITLNDHRIILLDEIEATLHPQWQKEILFLIVEYINFMRTNKMIDLYTYHLLITSHSPFILSDLPKENVIFLEKDEVTRNCKNVTKEINIDTFGANIHTLLSHAFFMKDGLMGEFAKSKINEIILNLNIKDYSPDINEKMRVLLIIKSIGEEFLKSKLLDMFYKKFDDDFLKEQRKQELIAQQNKITLELKNLI